MRRDIFQAIADPTRRAIIALIAMQAMTPNALAEHFDTSRQAISKHLRLLRSAGLVATQKAGAAHLCHLNARPLRAIDTWLRDYEMFWGESLRGLKNYIEETGKREKEKNR